MDEALRQQLLQMQQDDLVTRRRLIDAGQLYGPHLPKDFYHPEMAAVHHRNNAALRSIINQHGWPGRSLVGEDGEEAAWKIAQHAVLDPQLQEDCRLLLEAAFQKNEVPGIHLAMLIDRVCMNKGEPQIYGSIFVGGENGGLVPYPIADPEHVDQRRAAMQMPPLAEHSGKLQARVDHETRVQSAATGHHDRTPKSLE